MTGNVYKTTPWDVGSTIKTVQLPDGGYITLDQFYDTRGDDLEGGRHPNIGDGTEGYVEFAAFHYPSRDAADPDVEAKLGTFYGGGSLQIDRIDPQVPDSVREKFATFVRKHDRVGTRGVRRHVRRFQGDRR